MSKPLVSPRKPARRKNPRQSVTQLQTWQVIAQDIPIYFRKEPPLDPELFVYVRVVMLWPTLGKASLVDIRMSDAGQKPARFVAFFTGDCTGFFHDTKKTDQLCLYLSDATMHRVEEQSKQDTLNLPFTLTWDRRCRLKYVERGMVDRSIAFPTRTLLSFPLVTDVNQHLGKAEEKQAAIQAKANQNQKRLKRKKAASSVPEDELLDLSSALPVSVAEVPHSFDATAAGAGPLPRDRYLTPQPEEVRRARSHRAKKRKPQREGQKAAELQQHPAPPSDNVDPAIVPVNTKVISSKVSDDGLNPPKEDIIDLTIKEESRSATPTSLARVPGSNEDPAELKAGWVCSSGILDFHVLTRKQGSFLPLNDILCSTDTRRLYSTIGVVTHSRDVTETRTKGIWSSPYLDCWCMN